MCDTHSVVIVGTQDETEVMRTVDQSLSIHSLIHSPLLHHVLQYRTDTA